MKTNINTHSYIEALLEKYWQCETTLDEEMVLKDYFLQNNSIPSHLQKYKALFAYLSEQNTIGVSDNFDAKIMSQIKPKTSIFSFPMFARIAASIALVIGVGSSIFFFQHKDQKQQYAQVKVTEARKTVLNALVLVSDNMKKGEKIVDNSFKYFELLNKEDSTHNKQQK